MHREILQPKLADSGIGSGNPVSIQELSEVLGPLVQGTMVNATDQMLSSLKHAFAKLMAAKAAFRPFVVTYFSSSDFTEFDFPESHGLVDEQR